MKVKTFILPVLASMFLFMGCEKMGYVKKDLLIAAQKENQNLVNRNKELSRQFNACEQSQMDLQMQLDSLLDPNTEMMASNSMSASSGNYKYYCVMGSFKNLDYAQRYANKINASGNYGLEVISGPGSFYFSGVGTNSYSEAMGLITTLKTMSPNTWIFKNR